MNDCVLSSELIAILQYFGYEAKIGMFFTNLLSISLLKNKQGINKDEKVKQNRRKD